MTYRSTFTGRIATTVWGLQSRSYSPARCPSLGDRQAGSSLTEEGSMGRVFSGRDIRSWKVVGKDGQVLRYPNGKPMNDLDGFRSANELAREHGGTAVRV